MTVSPFLAKHWCYNNGKICPFGWQSSIRSGLSVSTNTCTHVHTSKCIVKGFCQFELLLMFTIQKQNLFCQDWKIFSHYWVIHCVLQHISNDWRVWNSEQTFALRWIDQQSTFVEVLSVRVNTTVCLKYIKSNCCVFHTSQQWGQNVLYVAAHR